MAAEETQHLQYRDPQGHWYPHMSACGEAPVSRYRLWGHPVFITCRRCQRTKQYQALVAATPTPQGALVCPGNALSSPPPSP